MRENFCNSVIITYKPTITIFCGSDSVYTKMTSIKTTGVFYCMLEEYKNDKKNLSYIYSGDMTAGTYQLVQG